MFIWWTQSPEQSLFADNNSASNESYCVYDSFNGDIPVGVEDGETVGVIYSLDRTILTRLTRAQLSNSIFKKKLCKLKSLLCLGK